MPKITTYQQLMDNIEKRINSALKDESSGSVFDVVKKTEQRNIDSSVYNKYKPKIYERRYSNKGLIADENIISKVDGTTISVLNVTDPNSSYEGTINKNLPELIEYGHGYKGYEYDYPYNKEYTDPRPFTKNTIEELNSTKKHVLALKNALKKQSLNVE